MNWTKFSHASVAVAVALIIIANAPAVVTDLISTAVRQIRVNAATTQPLDISISPSETVLDGSVAKQVTTKK